MKTGFQVITQIKPDISEYATFPFYSWIWYWDEVLKLKQPGRWLGVAETIGPVMTFGIVPISAIPTPKSTVIAISPTKQNESTIKKLFCLLFMPPSIQSLVIPIDSRPLH